MNKNIIKIVVKTIGSVILTGVAMMLFISVLVEKSEDGYGIDSNLKYIYKYGSYNELNSDFTYYDASDEKYNDDWIVKEAYNLRYDYKIYKKLYEETGDDLYYEKLQNVKERFDACLSNVQDEYKHDVVALFLDSLEEKNIIY